MPLILSGDTGPSIVSASAMPTGSVIQTLSVTKTDTFSTSSSTPVDITGLSITITPTSATSKILVFGRLNVAGGVAGSYTPFYFVVRDSTQIGVGAGGTPSGLGVNGDNSGGTNNFTCDVGFNFLDSPNTTSATVYKIQMQSQNSVTSQVNRPNARDNRGSSTITVMEIKG